MLPLLATIAGALGALLHGRRLASLIPGALVTWLWITSITCPQITVNLLIQSLLIVTAIGLGYTCQRLARPRGHKHIDIPLDKRIVFALFSGFLVRGFITVGSTVLLMRR
jgi:hypothetical protein